MPTDHGYDAVRSPGRRGRANGIRRGRGKESCMRETYPAALIVVPELHLQHLAGQGGGLLLGIARGHGGKDQHTLADGGHDLLVYRDGGRQHALQDRYETG
jgi:hypothetical protein